MVVFQPVTRHLLSALSLSSSQRYSSVLSYVTPSLQPAVVGPLDPASSVHITFTLLMFSVYASRGHKVLTRTCVLRSAGLTAAELFFTSFSHFFVYFLFLLSLLDGELYAGTSADFMGRDFAIFRTLGKHHPIRTEQHDSRWLNGETTGHFQQFIFEMLKYENYHDY